MAEYFHAYPYTDTIQKRGRRNCLIVEDKTFGDDSIILLSQTKMDELSLVRGDTVLVTGIKRKETICVVLSDDTILDGKIRMNIIVRNNLGVRIGDIVAVSFCAKIQYGKKVRVLPIEDTIEGLPANWFEVYLKPYFLEADRPVTKGNTFRMRAGMREVEFKIIETDPTPFCIVNADTVIYWDGEPIMREHGKDVLNSMGYDDIVGIRRQLDLYKRVLENPFHHPDVFKGRKFIEIESHYKNMKKNFVSDQKEKMKSLMKNGMNSQLTEVSIQDIKDAENEIDNGMTENGLRERTEMKCSGCVQVATDLSKYGLSKNYIGKKNPQWHIRGFVTSPKNQQFLCSKNCEVHQTVKNKILLEKLKL